MVRGAGLNRHEDAIDFDVVTELVFADRAAFDDCIAKLGVEAIATAWPERLLELALPETGFARR